MDIVRHLHFCPPGTPFFDAPASDPDTAQDFEAVHGDLPPGWTRTTGDEWVQLTPAEVQIPLQGWKIHASATLESAPAILGTVVKYCLTERLTFKFIRSTQVLQRRNSKYGDRSASGKFVTLYPVDDAHFARILEDLGGLLEGQPGPYILSDLRWRSGPLYVRYGGFVLRTTRSDSGDPVYCVEDPDGRLVPDRRGPGFRPPEWVTPPACLTESLAARSAGTLKDFPYRVTQAVHFSNGGGVYRGTDTRTGSEVLLREARPMAGLDGAGRDAVARHEREHWALRLLDGLPCIPRLVDYRIGHEHHFLVREYVEGASLSKEIVRRNPLLRADTSRERVAAYTAWALDVLGQIERGVEALHERGVVFADLHPGNVLVRSDGTVVFIDFETASAVDAEAVQNMGAVGFVAPKGYSGTAVDLYALGCLRLAVFAPLVAVLPWSPQKPRQIIGFIEANYPVPPDFAETALRDLGRCPYPEAVAAGPADGEGDWPELRTALAEGILASATPEREDRLFPGDAEQFFLPEGGVNLANGAAGVLWALAGAGVAVPEECVDWLAGAAARLREPRPGFCTGLAGIAYALHRLGRPETALELMDRAVHGSSAPANESLLDGVAGLGLACLDFAGRTGGGAYRDAAVRLAASLPGTPRRDRPAGGRPPGLLYGASGSALFLLRLYEETGEADLLVRAEAALRADLTALGWSSTEKGFPAEAVGRLPLVATGSGGTGLVLHAFLRHRADTELAAARDAIRDAAGQHFSPQAGLFHGRAGVLAVRLALAADQRGPSAGQDGGGGPDAVSGPAGDQERMNGFGLHLVRHQDRPAFLGRENLRISADLATGGAGVLTVLDAASAGRAPGLPFLCRTERHA